MSKNFKKNKKAFTLIEILAIIVVLAIVALIAIPNISGYVKRSREQSFRTSIDSLIHSYEYKNIDQGEIGRVSACSLDTNKCNMEGYIEKDEDGEITVYLTDGSSCAIGSAGSYEVKSGDCTREDSYPPLITNFIVSDITISSVTAYVNFTEDGLVTSIKFRLKDGNGNLVYDWQNADSIDNSADERVTKKTYKDLEQGKSYVIEVEIKNNSESNNTTLSSKTFVTAGYNAPTITYSKVWEKQKTVTITYTDLPEIDNKYRLKTNAQFDLTGWKDATTVQSFVIKNYHYYVEAKSTSGNANATASAQIGYVDNADDINNQKPSAEVSEYKNNGINTRQVNIKMNDTLSGVGYYCVSTVNNINNCSGTGNANDLNKWILASSVAEVREKTVTYELSDKGTYYVFVKDFVGNPSDGKAFTTYKVHYDLNGGTGNVQDQLKLEGNTLVLTSSVPRRDKYLFLGWDTNKQAKTPTYVSENEYTKDGDVTLYAIWKEELVVSYNSNLGTGDVEASTCAKYDEDPSCEITFRANGFTRPGYTFKGWALSETGAVTYMPNTKASFSVNTTVYAGWKANDLTFNSQTLNASFSTKSQTLNFTGASNGNGSYMYTELSEKNSSGTTTNYITISASGTITIAASAPVGTYTYGVRATSPVSNNIDNYTTVTKDAIMTIVISAYNLSGSTIADITALTYNGSAQTPEPKVTASETTLVKGTDFTYSYSSNKDAGTGTVTVTGKGNYTGTNSKTFTINKKSVAVSWTNTSLTFNNANQKPTASISTGVSGETMTLTTSGEKKAVGSYTASASCSSVTTNNRCANYNLTNTSTSYTISGYNIANATIANITAVTYNGSEHKPTPAVTALSTTLVNGTDFTYSYSNNKNAGTATVTVTGMGNYSGTNSKTFTINPKSITVSWTNTSFTYDRNSHIPTASISTGVSGETMTLTTSGAQTNAGSYTASASCSSVTTNNRCANYSLGSSSTSFTIAAYNLSNATIADMSAVNYNGTEYKPTPAVTALSTTLSSTNDYTYSYSNNKNAGTATVTVTGKGNYTGTKSKNFTINKVAASSNSVTCATLTYNGTNQSLIASTNISNGTVYYKVGTELTSSNYTTGSTSKPTAKDAGSYKVYWYAPADNYTESKGSVTCSMSPQTLTVPSSPAAKTYTAAAQASGITCPSGSTAGGTTSATNVGTYTHTCTLSSATNYKWNDNTTTAKSITWKINTSPSATTGSCKSLSYTGSAQTLASGGANVTYSNNSGTNAGTYTVTVTSTSNYTFSDGTTSKTLSCSIAKNTANVSMSLSSTSGTVYVGANTTLTVTGSNYGTLSCTSSNTNVATCSVSGTTITIVPKENGSATITVTGGGSSNYSSVSKTFTATVKRKYAVTISCSYCSSNPTSLTIPYNESGTATITATSGYTLTGATVSGTGCTLSGSTLTVSGVTSARTCSITAKPNIVKTTKTCYSSTDYYWGSESSSTVSSCSSNTFSCNSSYAGSTYTSCSKNTSYSKTSKTCNASYSWGTESSSTVSSCTAANFNCNSYSVGDTWVSCSTTYSYGFGSSSTSTVSSCTKDTPSCSSASDVGNEKISCSAIYSWSAGTPTTVSSCSATSSSCSGSGDKGNTYIGCSGGTTTYTKTSKTCNKSVSSIQWSNGTNNTGGSCTATSGQCTVAGDAGNTYSTCTAECGSGYSYNSSKNQCCKTATGTGTTKAKATPSGCSTTASCTQGSNGYTCTCQVCTSVPSWTKTTRTCQVSYSYGFGSSSTSTVSSCSSNTFTCNASNAGKTYVSCSPSTTYQQTTYTCKKSGNYTQTKATCKQTSSTTTKTSKKCNASYSWGSSSTSSVSSCSSNSISCGSSTVGQTYVSCTDTSDYTKTTKTCYSSTSYYWGSSSSSYVSSCTPNTFTCDYSHVGQTYVSCS